MHSVEDSHSLFHEVKDSNDCANQWDEVCREEGLLQNIDCLMSLPCSEASQSMQELLVRSVCLLTESMCGDIQCHSEGDARLKDGGEPGHYN